jgi:5-methylcytosine-specific restriction endonuclease McrA
MRGSNAARVDAEPFESEWVTAHRELSRLAQQRAALDAEEGRWLLAALRSAAHVHLGFGSFNEYIERLFGYSPRWTQEKLRVAEALEELPNVAAALEQGTLTWSAVRELTRVAVAETERDWLAAAAGKSVRQLEQLVAGARPGDSPSSPRDVSAQRHVLRFEVAAETFALFRDALCQLRRRSDHRVDDDTLLLEMARAVLGGPSDEGRSSYQVSLAVCPECARGAQLANGELVPVEREVVELARCDSHELGPSVPATNEISEHAHVGASSKTRDAPSAARARSRQTIPPALRRTVLQRDQRRCRVPGCHNATFLDVHHIKARSEGGRNEAANLITLCGAHHRAIHRAELVVEGCSAVDVRFTHADGSRYGSALRPQAADAFGKVSAALRHLGFRESDVRVAVAELRAEPNTRVVTAESLLRQALLRLTPAGGVH